MIETDDGHTDRMKACGRCGHTWLSHTQHPARCPGCGTYRWQGTPTTYTCIVCGHSWFSRTDRIPLRCPGCKTRSWMDGPRRSKLGERLPAEEDDGSESVLDRYGRGQGCVGISIDTGVPLSRVISIIRTSVPGVRMPRM